MKGIASISAAFIVMLGLGSIYNWSNFVPELRNQYLLSTFQTQIIFGTLIFVYPITMIFTGKLLNKYSPKILMIFSGLFFATGYISTYFSEGNFYILWLGIGVLGGIGTGIGYLISLTVPVEWFPHKKGLITGIASAGFGGGAIVMAAFTDFLKTYNYSVLSIFLIIGLSVGSLIILLSVFFNKSEYKKLNSQSFSISMLKQKEYIILVIGIFGGTFSGLMIIGNLKPIGILHNVEDNILVLSIAILSLTNFLGRLTWGWLSDYFSARILVTISLLIMGLSTFLIGTLHTSSLVFLILTSIIGFSFGANFVLFAKESIHLYGLSNYGLIYPYIFQGYGFAGIIGPAIGGILFDFSGSYFASVSFAMMLCLVIAVVFFVGIKDKRIAY